MPVREANNSRPRTGYSFADQGMAASAGRSGASVGKHVLRRIPGVDLWSPSWGEETVIRIFPALNPDKSDKTNEFDPYRFSTSYCDFGDWIRVYDAVRNFGEPGITMLLHNGLNQAYDAQTMNPCWVLYRAINQALSQGQGHPSWVPLTKGGAGRGPALSKPSRLYLVQCGIFRHKSQDTFGPGKPPLGTSFDGPTIVMGLPPTAGESLLQQLEEKTEDWKGDPDDMAQYKYGDVVGINQGAFVHIFERGKDPRARFNTSRPSASPADIYTKATVGPKAGMEAKGYDIFITKTLDGTDNGIPAALTGMESMVKGKVKPWDQVLEFKSDKDQAHLVAPLFPASAILYAWRDHPSWIPESVREVGDYEARKPVSTSVPGTTVASAWTGTNRPTNVLTPASVADLADTSVPVEDLSADPLSLAQRAVEARNRLNEATGKTIVNQ